MTCRRPRKPGWPRSGAAAPGARRSPPTSSPPSARSASSRPARCSARRSTTSATPAATAARARGAATPYRLGARRAGPRCRAGAATARSGPLVQDDVRGAPRRRSAGWSPSAPSSAGTAWSACGSPSAVPGRRARVQGDRHRDPRARRAAAAPPVHLRPVRPGLRQAGAQRLDARRARPRHLDRRQARRLADGRPDPLVGGQRRGQRLDRAGQRRPPRRAAAARRRRQAHRRRGRRHRGAWTMRVRERECPAQEGGRDHVIEAVNIGTAIVRLKSSHANGISSLRSPSCPSTRSAARRRASTSARTEGRPRDDGPTDRNEHGGRPAGRDQAALRAAAGQGRVDLHLRPVGERVPAGPRGGLPAARPGARLLDLPRRPADRPLGQEPGAQRALPGDVPRAGAGDDPDGGGGGRARRGRHRRRPARRRAEGVRHRHRRVHRDRHRGQGRAERRRRRRRQLAQQQAPAVHLRPVRPGLLDADQGRLRAAGHGHGHVRLPHRPPADGLGASATSAATSRSSSSPRPSTTPASWR